jgi:hypothetical protein
MDAHLAWRQNCPQIGLPTLMQLNLQLSGPGCSALVGTPPPISHREKKKHNARGKSCRVTRALP